MGIGRQFITQRLSNKNLPRRIREMFDRSNHMGDFKILIVNHVGKMIQACPVGALDDMILLFGPVKFHWASNQVHKLTLTFSRHFQTHHRTSAFGLETLGSLI